MTADKSVAGRYLGKLTPKATGNYRFVYEQGGTLEPVDAWMHVKHSTEETRRPNVDLECLFRNRDQAIMRLPIDCHTGPFPLRRHSYRVRRLATSTEAGPLERSARVILGETCPKVPRRITRPSGLG